MLFLTEPFLVQDKSLDELPLIAQRIKRGNTITKPSEEKSILSVTPENELIENIKDSEKKIIGEIQILINEVPQTVQIHKRCLGDRIDFIFIGSNVLGSFGWEYDAEKRMYSNYDRLLNNEIRGLGISKLIISAFEKLMQESGYERIGFKCLDKVESLCFALKMGYLPLTQEIKKKIHLTLQRSGVEIDHLYKTFGAPETQLV